MSFVHEDPEFDALLSIVARERKLSVGLVEKDYWVTHCLWSLHECGLDIWFKGGTSLSKGFGLIERFSEDLDLKIEPGAVVLPPVSNWKGDGTQALAERRAYFEALSHALRIPDVPTELDPSNDYRGKGANIRAVYPSRHALALPSAMTSFVLLEVGVARVAPSIDRTMSSFVHEYLDQLQQLGNYADNRPRSVRCVHPLVTLFEKLEAICRHALNEKRPPATFVRHFEDAVRIIEAVGKLPALPQYATPKDLLDDMIQQRDVTRPINVEAFPLPTGQRAREIDVAHAEIGPMFWGPRTSIAKARAVIVEWLAQNVG